MTPSRVVCLDVPDWSFYLVLGVFIGLVIGLLASFVYFQNDGLTLTTCLDVCRNMTFPCEVFK